MMDVDARHGVERTGSKKIDKESSDHLASTSG